MLSKLLRTSCFFALLAVSCGPREIVPETGRSRPALRYSEKGMETLGAEAYSEMSETHEVVSGTADANRVAAVGRRLQHSNERMSQPALKQLAGLPVRIGVGLWGAVAPGTRKLAMSAFGLGAVVGVFLPYSQRAARLDPKIRAMR